MAYEIDAYVPKVGDLTSLEYSDRLRCGALPWQDAVPSARQAAQTDLLLRRLNELTGMGTMRSLVELAANGVIGTINTPAAIGDDTVLEPALVLGGQRPTRDVDYDALVSALDTDLVLERTGR